jgi:hypothetical protein
MAEIQSWQRQNYSKNASTGPSTMNSKIAGDHIGSMHSKIAKPSVRNYADGGEVEPQYDQGEFAGVDNAVRANKVVYEDDVAPRVATDDEMRAVAPKNDDAASEVKVDGARKQSFKEAFAENRKAGNSTFEWNGKKFNTEVATGKQSPRMEAKRPESSGAASAPSSGGKSIMFKDKPAEPAAKSSSFDPDSVNNFGPRPEPKKERTYRTTRGGRIYDDELPAKEPAAPKVHPRTGRPY